MADSDVLEKRAITPFDVSEGALYSENRWQEPFAQLRRDMPVSFLPDSPYGPYWSVVTHDLVQQVELDAQTYSSSYVHGGITITTGLVEDEFPNFIAMDAPKHTAQRKVVQPSFNPSEMLVREPEIRQRTKELFDALPVGETFDWVEEVSVKLTIGMLCTLFDFPWEQWRDMKRWSDTASDVNPDFSEERRQKFYAEMFQMLQKFDELFERERQQEPNDKILNRIIHSEAMGNMPQLERLANIALLIVGGNDTTRNSMSGFVHACNLFPDQFELLRKDPSLVPNAAQEIIRWQSPVTHMRRTCTQDTELGGQLLSKGDKVIMWYISANRDENVFSNPDVVDFTRDNARRHIGFGHGVHRCVGARLAEMQLAILFEEILGRNVRIEQDGPLTYSGSCFLHEIDNMPVKMLPIG
ncbi:cytochrome P450 [Parasphingorhabdus halotolerans]|uniref:Cytochrome P450 n=1 Tax=Parasphingorhabdus halotolerans TaxID=2725558 RepID=A0A6H2DN56_9SPHN|nr:cytochrome P450 [Parasphingorhabdus halotolerans]QJB70099.1 cytochrome P450 [Parasphingorhabdus halotolerans]